MTLPAILTAYGTVGIDSKANLEIGRAYVAVAHRFRATGGTVTGVRWCQRFGPGGYSGGNGGTIKVSIQTDSAGVPSGTVLMFGTFDGHPYAGLNDSRFFVTSMGTPAALTAGVLYHVVFENTESSPTTNWCSANEVLDFSGNDQPAISNDYAVLTKTGSTWTVRTQYLGVTDVIYGSGDHDGVQYIEAMRAQVGYIGGSSRVREHFTASQALSVTDVGVRLIRISGSGDLTVTLNGVTATIPASSIPLGSVAGTSTGSWVSAALSTSLSSSSTYDVLLTAPAGTQYAMIPVREGWDTGDTGGTGNATGFRSYAFRDGSGQKSTDGGSTWADLYAYSPVDIQFYLNVGAGVGGGGGEEGGGEEPPPSEGGAEEGTASLLKFDVFPASAPNGPALGELSQSYGKQVRVLDNAIGSGLFKINRHDAQYAWCATDNLVRVRLVDGGPFDFDDERYIFAFWIEEGADALLSQDEEGGEEVQRGGRGGEIALRFAMLYPDAALSNNDQFTTTTRKDGFWHIANRTPGEVLRIVLRDAPAMVPNPIYFISHDFFIANDSAGVPWSDTDTDWALPVGASFLDILGTLVSSGLIYRMTPALMLHAYENSQAVNRSATVKFTKGDNISEAADRAVHASPAISRALVRGTTQNGTLTYVTVIDSTVEAAIGRRDGYVEYQTTPTTARLTKAGHKAIDKLKRWHDGPTTLGVIERPDTADPVAFTDYFPGDSVELHIPGEFEHSTRRVYGISLTERETGDYDVELEFEQSPFDPTTGEGNFGEPDTGTGKGCGDCPPPAPCDPEAITGAHFWAGGPTSIPIDGGYFDGDPRVLPVGFYNWSVTVGISGAHDSGSPHVRIKDAESLGANDFETLVNNDQFDTPHTYTGTFEVGGGHPSHTADVENWMLLEFETTWTGLEYTWWVDPVGFVPNGCQDGQPVRGALVVETPDGATDTFTAPTAMSADSLERVTVDGVDQTDEIVSVDYTANTVQLSFNPEADEEVRLWYTVGSVV